MVSIKLLTAIAVTIFAIPSSAAPLWKRADYVSASATVSGLAKGSCWWRFYKKDIIDNVHCAVQDLKGNSHSVFAELRYDVGLGVTGEIGYWANKGGTGAGMTYDTEYHTTNALMWKPAWAYVQVCDDGPSNTCKKSGKIDNPKV